MTFFTHAKKLQATLPILLAFRKCIKPLLFTFLGLIMTYNVSIAQTVTVGPCTGLNTFQEAIDIVVANDAPNQTILIDPSLFNSNSPGGNWGLGILAGASSNNLSGLTIDGQGSYIDGSNAAGLGFFEVSNIDDLHVKNFTFDNFNRSSGSFVIDNCENALVENVDFLNGATTQPLEISAENGNTSIVFNNCNLNGNPTSSNTVNNTTNTGALKIEGHASNTLSATFNFCQFRCNGRDVDGGGAVQINGDQSAARAGTTITFNDTEFANNNISSGGTGGGAIFAAIEVTLNINRCSFYNNHVNASSSLSAGGGGAIMLGQKATLNVTDSYFLSNSTLGGSSDGGAIGATAGGSSSRNTVTISGSIFALNNCTDEGGAMFFRHSDLTLTNSLFINNNAPDAGAIHIDNAGTYNFTGVTITGTTGGQGHGVENNGTLTLTDCIIVDNAGNNTNGSAPTNNNSIVTGTVAFTNPMPNGGMNPATYDYDVPGTQGAKQGVLADISSNTDCAAEAVDPPAATDPCDALGIISGSIFLDNFGDGTSGNNDGSSFTALDGNSGGTDMVLNTTVYLYSCTLCDGSDDVLEDQITTIDGTYSFLGLIEGDYFVSFDTPMGYVASTANTMNGGATGAVDSDNDMGDSHIITIAGGTNRNSDALDGTSGSSFYSNISAGFFQPITVEGTLYSDENFTTPEPNTSFDLTVSYSDGTSITLSAMSDGAGDFATIGFPPGDIVNVSASYGNVDQSTVIGGSDADGTAAGPSNVLQPSGSTLSLQDFALPVELLYFSVKSNGCNAALSWATVSEENSGYFSIQKSDDGREYTEVTRITAAGNSLELIEYEYVDKEPNPNTLYRLKIVDMDGSFDFSKKILFFDKNCGDAIQLVTAFPNPVKGKLHISVISLSQQPFTLSVHDVSGKIIMNENKNFTKGNNDIIINTGELAEGIYFLHVIDQSGLSTTQTIRFVKH